MNKPFFCLLALASFLILFSCKKEKSKLTISTIDTNVAYDNYMQLKPGNYWVYQDFMIDSVGGASHLQGGYDSDYVEKDTVINGNTYHKYCDLSFGSNTINPIYDIYFLRDSLSYVVNSGGRIMFSSTDFTNIFRSYTYFNPISGPDTLQITEQMGFKDEIVNVAAGSFVTSTFRRVIQYPANHHPFGLTREYDWRYSKNVGLVTETTAIYSAVPYYYERRLVRYHVQ